MLYDDLFFNHIASLDDMHIVIAIGDIGRRQYDAGAAVYILCRGDHRVIAVINNYLVRLRNYPCCVSISVNRCRDIIVKYSHRSTGGVWINNNRRVCRIAAWRAVGIVCITAVSG